MPEYKFGGVVTEISVYEFTIEADSPGEAADIIHDREFDWNDQAKHREYKTVEIEDLELLTPKIDALGGIAYCATCRLTLFDSAPGRPCHRCGTILEEKPCQKANSISAT